MNLAKKMFACKTKLLISTIIYTSNTFKASSPSSTMPRSSSYRLKTIPITQSEVSKGEYCVY